MVVSNRPGVRLLHIREGHCKSLHISSPASFLNIQVFSPHWQVPARREINVIYLRVQPKQPSSYIFSILINLVSYSICSGTCNGGLSIITSISLSFFHSTHRLLFGKWSLEPHLQVEGSPIKRGTSPRCTIQSTQSPVCGWGFV